MAATELRMQVSDIAVHGPGAARTARSAAELGIPHACPRCGVQARGTTDVALIDWHVEHGRNAHGGTQPDAALPDACAVCGAHRGGSDRAAWSLHLNDHRAERPLKKSEHYL